MYTLQIIGKLWMGGEAIYEYHVAELPSKSEKLESFVNSKAGDFDGVTDFNIIKTIHGGNWNHSWTKRSVVRPWKLEDSEETFLAAQGEY